ncbi:MAG: DNA internalization-related competence protein ComEC/Rec2 [Eubacteriales bacterium]
MREAIKGKRVLCYGCVLIILFILIRDSICGREAIALPSELEEATEGTEFSIVGVVYDLEEKDYGQVIYMESATRKWLVYDYNFTAISLGNSIQVLGELQLFDEARNQGNFDSLSYYNCLGLVASISATDVYILDESVFPIRNYLYQLRSAGISRIYDILGQEEGSLLVAMIFGDKNGMDDDQEELYQKIGISHIFAISGLHISLLSLAIYQLLRKTSGSFLLAGIVSGIFLGLYILMIGMGVSAIRAGVMFLIRIGADITGRVYDIRTSLALAALCILIPNSLYLYQSGFLLSFGAILGVIYLVPYWQQLSMYCMKKKGIEENDKINLVLQSIGASLGIQMMILPILLFSYYEVSPYSVLINLLVIPMMTLLLGVAMIGITLSVIWYAGGAILLSLSGWFLQVINLIGDISLALPFSRLIIGKPWVPMIVVYYLCIGCGIIYVHIVEKVQIEEGEGIKAYGRIAIIFALLPLLMLIHLPKEDLTITMLDVGQGDGLYIEGPNGGSYFVDGGSTDISSVGKYRMETYLLSIGVGTLDYVFISHGDVDHLNGIEEMLARQDLGVRIKTLVLCETQFLDDTLLGLLEVARENGTQVAIIKEGDQITEGEMLITYIAPLTTYDGEIGNASSMVLELSMGEFQMLFTGDVEGHGEDELISILENRALEQGLQEGEQLYDVLKVAHHGSSSSTSSAFLEVTLPDIALISAGVDSIYGHPHEDVLERLMLYDCEIYTTSTYGGVILSYNSNSDTITISTTLGN